jgi:hypothetical protein
MIRSNIAPFITGISAAKRTIESLFVRKPQPWYKPCLLCRIIGHKWVSLSHYRIGEREAQRIILWGCCTRCGKEAPQEMRRITENKADA